MRSARNGPHGTPYSGYPVALRVCTFGRPYARSARNGPLAQFAYHGPRLRSAPRGGLRSTGYMRRLARLRHLYRY